MTATSTYSFANVGIAEDDGFFAQGRVEHEALTVTLPLPPIKAEALAALFEAHPDGCRLMVRKDGKAVSGTFTLVSINERPAGSCDVILVSNDAVDVVLQGALHGRSGA